MDFPGGKHLTKLWETLAKLGAESLLAPGCSPSGLRLLPIVRGFIRG